MQAKVINKPWGHEIAIANEPAYGAKILMVKKNHRLSLQRHQQRDETWYVIWGCAIITIGESVLRYKREEIVQIPRGTWHRLGAEKKDIYVLEVTNGYVEGDIERKEDDYGREDREESKDS